MDEETAQSNDKLRLLEEEIGRLRERLAEQSGFDTARAIVETAPEPTAALDETGTIVLCNTAWTTFAAHGALAGLALAQGENYVTGLEMASGPNADDATAAALGIRDVIAGSRPDFQLEYTSQGVDGLRWIKITVRPLDRNGVTGAVVNHFDVTGCRSVASAQQDDVSFQSAVIEDLAEAVIACDAGGKVRLCNRAAREWHGHFAAGSTIQEWGRHNDLFNARTGAPVPAAERPLTRALRGEPVDDALFAIDVVGYPRRYMVASADPFYDPNGVRLGAVVVWRDVTEQRKTFEELQNQQLRLRETQRAGHVGSWEYDIASGELWGSEEAARIYGHPIPEGHLALETFMSHVREQATLRQSLLNLMETGTFYETEITLLPAGDGEPKIVAAIGEAVRDANGAVVKAVGIIRDITAERNGQEAVKEAGERLKLALDAAGANPFEWDLRSNTFFWAEQRKSLLGLSPDAYHAHYATVRDAVHREDIEGLEAALAAARDGCTECNHEFRAVWTDNSIHWIEVRGRFEYDLEGRPVRMTGVVMDVTARRIAEEEKERLAAIVDCTTSAIVSVGLDGAILTWNPAAERMSGFSQEEVRGKPISEFITADRPAALPLVFSRLWRGEPVGPIETRGVCKHGKSLDLAFTAAPVRLRGAIIGAAAMVRDVTAVKRTQRQLDAQVAQLKALRSIDLAILGAIDTRLTLGTVVKQTLSVPGVDAASILLLDRSAHTLTYSVGAGFKSADIARTRIQLGQGLPGTAAMKRWPVVASSDSFGSDTPERTRLLSDEGFTNYAAFPLIAKGEVEGVLEAFSRTPFDADSDTLEFLEAVAGQAAIAIDSASLFENLQRSNTNLILAYDATIEGWSKALDLRDAATQGHSERVTDLSLRLACSLPVPTDQIEHIRRGALLHDIGKMAIPDSILLKPDSLTDSEMAVMRRHTEYAHEMLSPIEFLRPAIEIPYCHHERWDGTGYPRGLKDRHIPLAARIFAVVDVWDALCSDRPYRPAWPRESALAHIRERTGSHFDPMVVDAFLKIIGAS